MYAETVGDASEQQLPERGVGASIVDVVRGCPGVSGGSSSSPMRRIRRTASQNAASIVRVHAALDAG
jgi:hypothetical protein